MGYLQGAFSSPDQGSLNAPDASEPQVLARVKAAVMCMGAAQLLMRTGVPLILMKAPQLSVGLCGITCQACACRGKRMLRTSFLPVPSCHWQSGALEGS